MLSLFFLYSPTILRPSADMFTPTWPALLAVALQRHTLLALLRYATTRHVTTPLSPMSVTRIFVVCQPLPCQFRDFAIFAAPRHACLLPLLRCHAPSRLLRAGCRRYDAATLLYDTPLRHAVYDADAR